MNPRIERILIQRSNRIMMRTPLVYKIGGYLCNPRMNGWLWTGRFYGKTRFMAWIYLSPHFDDIALSCGGLVWEQAQRGEAPAIWTICAGDPPPGELSPFAQSLHARWEASPQAAQERRLEDQAACRELGADWRYFDLPDCIYRPGGESGVFYYASEESLFGEVHPGELPLMATLAEVLRQALPGDAQIVCPLTLGGHVDHRLTRRAAEQLGRAVWYYADYPYVMRSAQPVQEVLQGSWTSRVFPVSEAGLAAWQASIAAHQSQISTFWSSLEAMAAAMREYWQAEGGVRLWQRAVEEAEAMAFLKSPFP